MKTTIIGIASIGMLVAPLLSLAQTSPHPTRAEVRAELVQLEKAGYKPKGKDENYPDDLQAAEARVAAGKTAGGLPASGMGSSTGSASQSGGSSTSHHSPSTLYEHH